MEFCTFSSNSDIRQFNIYFFIFWLVKPAYFDLNGNLKHFDIDKRY